MKKMYLQAAVMCMLAACGQQNQQSSQAPQAAAAPQESDRQKLFVDNCAVCHSLTEDRTGPALNGALGRWNNDTTLLIAYIKNSQAVISSKKNAHILRVYQQYNQTIMPPFSNLSQADIRSIIDYISSGTGTK